MNSIDQMPVEYAEYDISGMTCTACAGRVERAINKVDGVHATVNYATERALVSIVTTADEATIIAQVRSAGYDAHLHKSEDDEWARRASGMRVRSLRRRLIIAALLTIPLMDITIVFALVPGWRFPAWEWVCVLLALPVATWAAWPFHRATLRNLRHGAVSMDTLVSLGITVSLLWALVTVTFDLQGPAYWIGFGEVPDGANGMYLDVAAGMTTLQLAGRYFESRSRQKAGDVLGALSRLSVREVRVMRDGVEMIVPIASLKVGDTFVVFPGETLPADGTVMAGSASVDRSMMTGEPVPAEVVAGDTVHGGTISTDGHLRVRATSVGGATQLAQMAALAEQAQASKANVQTLVDRITVYFVPAVIGLALATFLVWMLCGAPPQQAIGTGIAVLIIACPCALGLATPTALMVGVGRGATLGILVKGQEALEASGRVTTVVFDKTGTLTTGRMKVQDVMPNRGVDSGEMLTLAASVEQASEHAIARAIIEHAEQEGVNPVPFTDFRAAPGQGATATITEKRVLVGNAHLLREHGISTNDATDAVRPAHHETGTVVYVAVGDRFLGSILIADTIKPDAAAAVSAFHSKGMRTVLLTGDTTYAARRTADEVGIETAVGDVLPSQKAEYIRRLQAERGSVAMIGDGINDAVALSAADLGVAVVTGTDIAMRSADIILVRDDLLAAVDAIALARRTLKTIRSNLVWAFGYNVAAIPLAAAGLLNPLIAAAAMSLSSVIVVQNSLRLRNFQSMKHRTDA